MSWHAVIQNVTKEQALAEIASFTMPPTHTDGDPDSLAQLEVAKAAATAILDSGHVGSDGYYTVEFTGHAVPGHVLGDEPATHEHIRVIINRTINMR